MTASAMSNSSGSQTVGPYFRIGMEYLLDRAPTLVADGRSVIEITGTLLDRDRNPVPDAVLEFYASGLEGSLHRGGFPVGFRRVPTDDAGRFSAVIERPKPIAGDPGQEQAPHLVVSVFMRGLLRQLLTRVYLWDDPGLQNDPVLKAIADDRRATLIAQPGSSSAESYRWDLILQSGAETVFFAW